MFGLHSTAAVMARGSVLNSVPAPIARRLAGRWSTALGRCQTPRRFGRQRSPATERCGVGRHVSRCAALGDYTVRIQATHNGQLLGEAQARFLVYEQDRELENPAADRGALENLAMMTGGRAIAPEQLPELLEQFKKAVHNFEVETQVRRTLWDTWPFFLAFIGLLVVEWFLRKRWGLV